MLAEITGSWVPGWAAAAAVLLLGLAAGSAAGLLVVRIPVRRGQQPSQVGGPRCDGPLQPRDLIPLTGWLRLRSRSPACRADFGIWFPAAELITAGLFVALWFRFGPSPALPAFCYLAVISVPLAFIDARHRRLPDALTLPSYPAALVLLGIGAAFVPGGGRHLVHGLIGMAAAWLFFVLQAFMYPAGVGWGDVKLSGVLGLYLGWLGARALLEGLLGGYLLAALAGVGLLLAGRATRKSLLPFGPFMLASSLAVIIAGGWSFS
jgi:leader peptidase (prepilin peptidase) / N-methyltransferase